ncbi:MAG TPA: hypothetical protein VKX28_12050 [Xanthobacteraceae bacterium]|nr:hypothetical protein [Xanthobacteraceae bacterium]
MTRTFTTIAALAFICAAAPAFAHGGGHTGSGMGTGMGNNGQNGHSAPMSWNLADHKGDHTTTNTTGNNVTHTGMRAGKIITHVHSGKHQERIMRQEAEVARLAKLRQQASLHNDKALVAQINMRIQHLLLELSNEGLSEVMVAQAIQRM